MWFLPSLLSKSRHDSARCLSRCLPLRLGAALLTPTEPKRFHWEYSRARGYALTQVPYWTETLIFLHTVGNNPSSSVLRNTAEQLLQPSGHSLLKNTAPHPQPANEVNAVASSLLGRSTMPYQVWGTPPFFPHTPWSCTTAAKGRKLFHRAAIRKGGGLAMSSENVSSSPSYPSEKQIFGFASPVP